MDNVTVHRVFNSSLRLFFAPLVGAFNSVLTAMQECERAHLVSIPETEHRPDAAQIQLQGLAWQAIVKRAPVDASWKPRVLEIAADLGLIDSLAQLNDDDIQSDVGQIDKNLLQAISDAVAKAELPVADCSHYWVA
jgi:hypothetical protein